MNDSNPTITASTYKPTDTFGYGTGGNGVWGHASDRQPADLHNTSSPLVAEERSEYSFEAEAKTSDVDEQNLYDWSQFTNSPAIADGVSVPGIEGYQRPSSAGQEPLYPLPQIDNSQYPISQTASDFEEDATRSDYDARSPYPWDDTQTGMPSHIGSDAPYVWLLFGFCWY
jgi:hypothetical protein